MAESPLGNIVPAILIIVMAGLLLAVGMTILGKLGQANLEDITTNLENHTFHYDTWVTLANSRAQYTSVVIVNSSNGAAVSSALYSFDVSRPYEMSKIKLSAESPTNFTNLQLNVTYIWGDTTEASTAIEASNSAVDDFVDWMPIIVIVLISGIVVFLVVKGLTGKER